MSGTDRVVILGGTGFIGRALVARLAGAGVPCRVVAHVAPERPLPEGVEFRRADVRDADALAAACLPGAAVVNLAGAHGLPIDAAACDAVNARAAGAVAQALERSRARALVFVSTAKVYGHARGADESVTPSPSEPYGRSKLAAERTYEAWAAAADDRALTIVRPAVVFGPGAHATGGAFLRRIAAPDFRLEGDGEERKALAYVGNLAAFLHARLAAPARPGVVRYNYADQPQLAWHEIVACVREAVGLAPAPVRRVAPWRRSLSRVFGAAGGVERLVDARRAFATGFVAPHPLRDALADTARAEIGALRFFGRHSA
ncbi:MAG: NAD(P)-dependent oxidoreductase [Gemmatimonadetes bacterium]|nr:NAD(P)-dependent oxidoreductase [Gemmatimonadota bacterium]